MCYVLIIKEKLKHRSNALVYTNNMAAKTKSNGQNETKAERQNTHPTTSANPPPFCCDGAASEIYDDIKLWSIDRSSSKKPLIISYRGENQADDSLLSPRDFFSTPHTLSVMN